MNILTWIVFGLIVGVIANALDPRPAQGGLGGADLLGVVGALVGGCLDKIIVGVDVPGVNLSSLGGAVLGSLLLLFIGRALSR